MKFYNEPKDRPRGVCEGCARSSRSGDHSKCGALARARRRQGVRVRKPTTTIKADTVEFFARVE